MEAQQLIATVWTLFVIASCSLVYRCCPDAAGQSLQFHTALIVLCDLTFFCAQMHVALNIPLLL